MKYAPSLVGVGQLSGSSGSTTASRNRFGSYLRNRTIPVNPASESQTVYRGRLQQLSSAWRDLTAGQRDGWNNLALNHPRTDSLGQTYYLSGQEMFVADNLNRYLVSLAQLSSAPVAVIPPNLTTFTATASAGAGSLDVVFAPVIPANRWIVVYATRPLSPGVTFIKESDYRVLAVFDNTDLTPQNVGAAYIAMYGTLEAGQKIALKALHINSTGFRSTEIRTSLIVAA